jgi:hypothetical protein
MPSSQATGDDDHREVMDSTLATVLRVLHGMHVEDVSEDAVLAAPPFYDGPVLLKNPGRYAQFNGQMAYNLRFVGYPFDEVAFLTVRQFCEMYVRDSFPAIPKVRLSDEQYEIDHGRSSRGPAGDPKAFPICFVLGAPRSGTTLLRAMLNVHTRLWAPGELHLANFTTMTDRAHHVAPVLRYMPIPECASRCGEPIAAFSRTFRGWELAGTPVMDVFQHLHDADPGAMVVDKSPPYSVQLETLARIGERFPNAKFVHLIRSPYDMIRSYVRMQLHRGDRRLFEPGRNPYQAAEAIWYACNANIDAFLGLLPADRKCTTRYEDLTAAPPASLQAICSLLERDFQPSMADPYATPEPTALGAGDLHIHLLDKVEHRPLIAPFYELGSRCKELADRYAY